MLDFVDGGVGVVLLVDGLIHDRPNLCTVPITDAALKWTLGAVTLPTATSAARELLAMLG